MSGNAPESTLNLTSTTASTLMASVTTELSSAAALAIDPLSHVGDGIFLQTKTAQGIAGACVWVALFLTCQQVRFSHCSSYLTWKARHVLFFLPTYCRGKILEKQFVVVVVVFFTSSTQSLIEKPMPSAMRIQMLRIEIACRMCYFYLFILVSSYNTLISLWWDKAA